MLERDKDLAKCACDVCQAFCLLLVIFTVLLVHAPSLAYVACGLGLICGLVRGWVTNPKLFPRQLAWTTAGFCVALLGARLVPPEYHFSFGYVLAVAIALWALRITANYLPRRAGPPPQRISPVPPRIVGKGGQRIG
jgi:hypothetical protein